MEDTGMWRPVPVVLVLFLNSLLVVYWWWMRDSSGSRKTHNGSELKVPFIYIASNSSKRIASDRAIQSSLAQFRNEAAQAIQGLSRALETALELEANTTSFPVSIRLSTKLQRRILPMAKCLEEEERLLEQLLLGHGFQPILVLPDEPLLLRSTNLVAKFSTDIHTKTTFRFTRPIPHHQILPDDNAYDSAGQVIAHLVRDWTQLGRPVRRNLYDWCLRQLQYHHHHTSGSVLVPGAGMGRLAYQIYHSGYTVEANELSPVMAAAAQSILHHGVTGRVHPFLLDRLWNEVDAQGRFDSIDFPDTSIASSYRGSLSFTIGDFGGMYYSSNHATASFGALVTCFFLDTATNIYEYLEVIENLLCSGGTWINVGPLQWHGNALLFPSADELKELVAHRFRIVRWSIDAEPMAYRDTARRLTNFDGYRPLRFVAIRK